MSQRSIDGPDRNLALELVRVTEAAAMAAARQMGMGDKIAVDQAGVDAMRAVLGTVAMRGTVVIGEGEKDHAPMLYNGEHVGSGDEEDPELDIAVDPVEGTTLVAKSLPNALAVVALAERGTLFDPGPCVYMDKLAVGPEAAGAVELDAPVGDTVKAVARAKGGSPGDVTVAVLDRPRHDDLIDQIRRAGARVRFLPDGDVAGAITAARPGSGVDACMGIGGTPEGVLAAAAMRCLGGQILGRLSPRDDDEHRAAVDQGYDLDSVLDTEDLAGTGEVFFAASGITDGELLRGVRFRAGWATTDSLSMRAQSGTVRRIEAEHPFSKLNVLASYAEVQVPG